MSKRETRNLEFKLIISKSYLKTVSAFANYGDGEIYFGVDDDGNQVGIKEPDKVCLDLENKINDSIKPRPDFKFKINRKTNVITLSVMEGMYKPYLYKGKAYKRNDTATVEIDQVELTRLILAGNNMSYEKLQYMGKQTLSFHLLEKKLVDILGIEKLNNDILRTLNLCMEDGRYNNAAGLLADKNDFPGTDAAKFGKDINEIMERKILSGISVLEQYEQAVDMFRRHYQYEEIKGTTRNKIELIPEEAFREVLANAIVHRNWDVDQNIRIAMFNDHIEVSSPGGLPYGLSKEEYMNGNISNLRNPVLGGVFFRLNLIEMFGTGIRRIKYAYRDSTLKPIFEVYENSIVISLPVTTTNLIMTQDETKIYNLLKDGSELSSGEMSKVLGFSRNKVVRVTGSLVNKRYIRVIGSGRGTRYSMQA